MIKKTTTCQAMNNIDDECDDDLPEEVISLPPETSQTFAGIATYNQPSAIRDEELRDAVRSVNVKQRITYDVVLSWCRNSIKSVNCLTKAQFRRRPSAVPNLIAIRFDCSTAETRLRFRRRAKFRIS